MKTQNQNTESGNKLRGYYVEQVTNNGVTYFQEVRRRDGAILYSNVSLTRVADRIFKPTYEDGTPVVL